VGVWAAAAPCGCPKASFVKSSAHDGPRRSAFRVLGSAGKAPSLYAVPADVPEPSTSVVTVFAHASARDGARTNFAGEKRQTAARNLGEKERALFNARDRFT
jgi:hypothetical protein